MHHLNAALRAHALFHRDVDYIVRDGEIIIVDEFTGRTMPGRRWSEGLHQAVEAKEGVRVQSENQTLASITFQNYFRLYQKLAGMTGTADTEAYEFQQIYASGGGRHSHRQAHDPRPISPTWCISLPREKFNAIIEDIKDCRKRGQPALVGTASIETSEYLSRLLDKDESPHQVLNAKYHEREAEIVAQAGRPGSGDHRHQHGRSRHRHRAGRQSGRGPCSGHNEADDEAKRTLRGTPGSERHEQVVAKRAGCTSSAPSATSRGASTTSCAGAPVARETRAPAGSTCRWKTTSCASSPRTAWAG